MLNSYSAKQDIMNLSEFYSFEGYVRIIFDIQIIMGNTLESCRPKTEDNSGEVSKKMEEWYDPFAWMKKRVITKRGVVAYNMPKDNEFVDTLPVEVVRR